MTTPPTIPDFAGCLLQAGGGLWAAILHLMPKALPQYTVVRVAAIRGDRFMGQPIYEVRHPRVGDVGTVIEVHQLPELSYEVECSDGTTGETLWLSAMYPDELECLSAT